MLLLAVQTAGAGVVYWYGLPLYRKTVADPMGFEPRPLERSLIALAAVILMQVPYWIAYRIRPPMPRLFNAPFGHVVIFLARLDFLLPASIYSFVFVLRRMGHLERFGGTFPGKQGS